MKKALFRILLTAALIGSAASGSLADDFGPWRSSHRRPEPHFVRIHDDWHRGPDRWHARPDPWPGFRGPSPWVRPGMPAWDHWHRGYWHYTTYGGRLGWWWIVDGYWFLYPTRVMPYPDYYTAPVITMQSGAPVVIERTETVVTPAPSALPADQTSPTYTDESGQTCREYQSTIMVGGRKQHAYGTACLQPDGTWRVVK